MQELPNVRVAGRTPKAICLTCACKFDIQTPDGVVQKEDWVDLWFPKGKDYPQNGHIRQDGQGKWFARTWIIKKNEDKEAKRRPGCIRFEVVALVEHDTSNTPCAPVNTAPASVPRPIEEDVSPDDLPF